MTHDPLCPWNQPCPGSYEGNPHEFISLDPPTLPPACYNCSSTECRCYLIARVREDERTNEPTAWAYANGYAAALRDAVKVVKALPICACDKDWETGEHQDWCAKRRVIAAIEALND